MNWPGTGNTGAAHRKAPSPWPSGDGNGGAGAGRVIDGEGNRGLPESALVGVPPLGGGCGPGIRLKAELQRGASLVWCCSFGGLKDSGRNEDAVSAWEQALRLAPNDQTAQPDLQCLAGSGSPIPA